MEVSSSVMLCSNMRTERVKELSILSVAVECINEQIKSLNIEIEASEQRKDTDMCRYLQGKKHGLAVAVSLIEDIEETP